ncbi:MAG: alpha/beta hydrolase, partial [Agathobacter sp.]
MGKKYDEKLLTALKQRQKVEDYHGAPVLVKYLPDSDERGAMDPRLYNDQKKALKMMAWMPSFLMKMDTSEKGIANLREMFNGVKSVPCVETPVYIERRTVVAEDGYEIPVRIYKRNKEDHCKGILYYIHGGGFFGGSPDVVEESVKMFVAKSGLCAVSPDYRLAPENPYPVGHQDCYQVLQWIYENADSFGADKEHIFVAGDSAGGNLTQYCTTRDWEDGNRHVKGQLLL